MNYFYKKQFYIENSYIFAKKIEVVYEFIPA